MKAEAIVAALLFALVAQATAAELDINLHQANGQGVANAVVRINPLDPAETARHPATSPTTHVIDQRDETFIPYVSILHPGDSVVFRNSDNTRHHVYSFAEQAAFEMVIKPGHSSEPVRIASDGIIAVGCNIHDQMITYLVVSDAVYSRTTGADGKLRFPDLPAGRYSVEAWHPQLRPGQDDMSREIQVSDDAPTQMDFQLHLGPDPRGLDDPERVDY